MSKLETNFLASKERLSLIRDHKLEKDGRKRDRMKFILLYNDGWSYAQIAKVLLLDDQTLRNYLKDYESGGMKSLLSFHYTGRPTILSEFECKELEAHLSDNTYLTSYQIRKYIKAKYKKEYSKKGIISLLHKMGFVYKKATLYSVQHKIRRFESDNIAQYKDELDTLMTENFNIIRHKPSNFILD